MRQVFRQSGLLRAVTSMRGPKKQADVSVAPAVLRLLKDQAEEPVAKGIEDLPAWLINIAEPQINYAVQSHIMTQDTDLFYPTVESFKSYRKKGRKHLMRLRNNEQIVKNARFEVPDRPIEDEFLDDYAFERDEERQAEAVQREESAKQDEQEDGEGEEEEEEEITDEEMRRLEIE